MGGKPRPKFDPGFPYRVQIDEDNSFDELVVGQWFHMERMDKNWWWMRIGDTPYVCTIKRDGTVDFRKQNE